MFIDISKSLPPARNINKVRKTFRITPPRVGQRVRQDSVYFLDLTSLDFVDWTWSHRDQTWAGHSNTSWVSSTPPWERQVDLLPLHRVKKKVKSLILARDAEQRVAVRVGRVDGERPVGSAIVEERLELVRGGRRSRPRRPWVLGRGAEQLAALAAAALRAGAG